MSEPSVQLPRLSPDRVAAAVERLARDVEDADLRAQLHALAGIVRNLVVAPVEPELAAAYARLAAVDDADLPGALARLAALEEDRVAPIDWDLASRG